VQNSRQAQVVGFFFTSPHKSSIKTIYIFNSVQFCEFRAVTVKKEKYIN